MCDDVISLCTLAFAPPAMEQKNRGQEEQENRGTGKQENRGTEEQGNRGTKEQGNREQGGREAGEQVLADQSMINDKSK